MRRPAVRTLLVLAAACWLAAARGGLTLRALVACQHHQPGPGHAGPHGPPSVPSDAPCFCADMTGASDLATVSPAAPAPEPLRVVAAAEVAVADPSLLPLPPSPAFSPESPPPDCA